MTKIYLVRHCEAIGNVLRIFQGSTDLDISELGAKQLEFLEKRFENIPLDRVLSSPLLRTQKTAKAIIGKKDIEFEIYNDIIELHGGVVEGRPFQEAFNEIEGLADTWNNHPEDFAPQNGEPMRHAYERIWNAVCTVARENKDKTVALSTHGGVLRCLFSRLLNGSIEKLKDTPWCENTAVSLLEFDDNFNCKVVFYNDFSHLPEEFVNRKSRIVSKIDGDKK